MEGKGEDEVKKITCSGGCGMELEVPDTVDVDYCYVCCIKNQVPRRKIITLSGFNKLHTMWKAGKPLPASWRDFVYFYAKNSKDADIKQRAKEMGVKV